LKKAEDIIKPLDYLIKGKKGRVKKARGSWQI
jgi:hypothetical protein